ncbi:glycosyltransferase family 25 protein [uncultured Mucilaginibacter sp.]|uniref:glycosyltransferase family 25 protein n=1 Tax=uncultured Mucilaginibacter sp. TaxID=797541 RepID=UPI002636050B|nr:glycosyltransferase family 25 protein [uncultured Mucilaginibacter sp.]
MLTTTAVEILNGYFDKILLLTIERNLHRLEGINKNFNGLNIEVFMGVDGGKLNIQELQSTGEIAPNINQIYKQNNLDYLNLRVGPLLKNQIAVASSHKKMYQYIKENHLQKVLILEDDAIPVEKNLQYLAETLKQVPQDCELLFLGHIYNNDFSFFGKLRYYYLTNFFYRIGLRTKAVIRKKKSYPTNFSSLLKKQGGHIGTHAYALIGQGAAKLLDLQTPLTYGASDLLTMDAVANHKICAYTCRYMFFQQNSRLPSSVYNN